MTTLVPQVLKVFIGLRRVATKAAEGIKAGDTVEVVKFNPSPSGPFDGVESGYVDLKNLRTGKISRHGACVLGLEHYLCTVAPPIPTPTLKPLGLTRRPLRAKSKLDTTKLANPKLRVRVTREDIAVAAKAVRTPGARRTECCVISRAMTRELRKRFRRHPDIHASTGYSGFAIRDADKVNIREGIDLPEVARDLILRFDRRTHPGQRTDVSVSDLGPIEFEVDLQRGYGR